MLRHFYSNYSATIIIIISVILIGIIQFSKLPIALYPQCEKPKLYGWIRTGSTDAKEFKERYGDDIEIALSAVSDVIKVKGDYYNGFIKYTIEFDWGVESDDAKINVKTALSSIETEFPESFGNFRFYYKGSESSEVIVSLFSEKYMPDELADIAETSFIPHLNKIDGINETFVIRFDERYLLITIDPYRLTSFGLNFNSVFSKLKAGEHDKSLGKLDLKAGGSYQVTTVIKENEMAQLKDLIVGEADDTAVRLKDIAEITLKEELPRVFFKAGGRRSLLIGGIPKPDANIKKVCDEFIEQIKVQVPEIDDKIEFRVLLNPSVFINEAVRNVITAVILGMVIAIFIIFLFLGSLKNTIVISISIPFSLIAGFILMNAIGIEINLISLGAMALAVGMVVDGSIVVLENIIRTLNEHPPKNKRERLDQIIKATMEVKNPIIASLLTTIIVFAPLPFTSPITSAILGDLAIVMVCVLLISILVTLFLIPPLAMMLRIGDTRTDRNRGIYFISFQFITLFNWLKKRYLKAITVLIENRIAALSSILLFILLLGVGSYLLLFQVDREIMATPDTDKIFLDINIKGEKKEISEVEKIMLPYEKILMTEFKADISHILSIVRSSNGSILAFLKDKSQIKRVKKAFEDRFKNTPEFDFYVEDWTPTSLEIPKPALIHINVNEKNEDKKRDILKNIEEALRKSDDIGRVDSNPNTHKKDYLKIIFDKEQMVPLTSNGNGNAINTIESLISGYLKETKVKEIKLGDKPMDVKIRIGSDYFKSLGDIENLLLRFDNKIIPLKALAQVNHTIDWGHYYTEDSVEVASIRAWTKSSFKGDKEKLAVQMKDQIKNHPDINASKITFNNTDKEVNENIHSLTIALVFALLLIFILITLQFGSIVQTGIIMLAIPFGFLGVTYSLWIFSSTLSVNSMLGLILLCGTAVNNSIIFLDFYNKIKKRRDMNIKDALLKTARLRFRPILITTATTTLGMFPISFGMGSGGEILKPLGIAICGGLWISTILTIILIPLAVIASEKLITLLRRQFLQKAAVTAALVLFCLAGINEKLMAAVPDQLTLKTAEEITIDHHFELKAARYEERAADALYRSIYSEILPSLSVEKGYRETFIKYHDDAPLSGKYTLKEDDEIFTIEEKIQNPLTFWTHRNILKNNRDLKKNTVSEMREALLFEVRNIYFRYKVIEVSLKNAVQNKTLAKKMLQSSEHRFKQGFIHRSDAKRARVKFNEVTLSVTERTHALHTIREKLSLLLGAAESEHFKLTDPLPKAFKYFSHPKEKMLHRAQKGHPEKIERLKLLLKNKELSLKKSNYGFLPDLTLGASFSKTDSDDIQYDLTHPTVYAYAKWTLYSGGKQFFNRKAALLEKKAVSEHLKHTRDDLSRAIKALVGDLDVLKEKFILQRKSVEILQEISKESEKRFKRGLVNSKQVNDDFSNFLSAQDKLHAICLNIINEIATLSEISGDEALFYWMF